MIRLKKSMKGKQIINNRAYKQFCKLYKISYFIILVFASITNLTACIKREEIIKQESIAVGEIRNDTINNTINDTVNVTANDISNADNEEDNMNIEKGENLALDTGIQWMKEEILVYKPSRGGVWYPRMYHLQDGRILCGFDTNEDGARAVIKIVSSEDGGYTWSLDGYKGTNNPEYDCANANFIELDNGDIWLAYRANVMEGEEYYSSIRVNVSKDGGSTWIEHSIVAEEKGKGGVYEPQFQFIGDQVAVFYANDSLNVVKNNRQQNIEYKIWTGDSWSRKYIASNGTKTYSRDGMPVLCRLADGSYGLVIESTALHPSYEFIIQLKLSPDGMDWSGPLKDIYIPNKINKKAGAPYIVTLSDGRLLVSFQTDEDASNNGDAFSKMKVMISKDSSGNEFLPITEPFDTPDGFASSWNSLLSYDNSLLAVTSTNYPWECIMLRIGKVK